MADRSFRLDELARAAGVNPRTVRYYVELGLLPPPEFRSTATTYDEEHLLRLLAVRRLRKAERLRLPAIKRRLSRLTLAELRALAGDPLPNERPAIVDPVPVVDPPCVRWDRIELLPGLELNMRSDASPLLRRLAREIHAQFGGDASRVGEVPSSSE